MSAFHSFKQVSVDDVDYISIEKNMQKFSQNYSTTESDSNIKHAQAKTPTDIRPPHQSATVGLHPVLPVSLYSFAVPLR